MKKLMTLVGCSVCLLAAAAETSVGEALAKAPWLGNGRDPDLRDWAWTNAAPAAVFRTSFALPAGKDSAKLSVAVLGYYELKIDGQSVQAIAPMPLPSVFSKTIWSDSYDVRGAGAHTLELALGNGWYNIPRTKMWGWVCFHDKLVSGTPCFKAAVEGVAKLDWTWTDSETVVNSIQQGTWIDRTRPADTAPKPAVVTKGEKGTIRPRLAPPVAVIATRHGKVLSFDAEKRVQVVDFGANTTGVPEFDVTGAKRGTRIEVRYGELLFTNGLVNCATTFCGSIEDRVGARFNRVDYPACQCDVYVAKGEGVEIFRPKFTWHVGRYAEIRGLGQRVRRPIWHVVSSAVADAEPGASFRSGEEDLNRIHALVKRTFRANMIGLQSDCPGRERLGYGGDIVPTADAMILNYDMREFYLKVLNDFADEAADDGAITETAPYVGIGDQPALPKKKFPKAGPIGWALAVPHLIDRLWTAYGDRRALAFYPVAARYARLIDQYHPTGEVPACIGDHEARIRISNEAFAVAHWHEFARLTAKIAGVCGKQDEAREFAAMAEKARKLFVSKYVKDGVVDNASASAQATALYLGLVPEAQRAAADAALLKALERDGWHFTTGIFATRYLLMYLHETGRDELARRLVLAKGAPGYLHMIERGATTLWETWKEWTYGYSTCHPMFGSVDEWILKSSVTDRADQVIPKPTRTVRGAGVHVFRGAFPMKRCDDWTKLVGSFARADDLKPEGYRLSVTPEKITVASRDKAGAFYATRTLAQLATILPDRILVPCCTIEDAPRYAWRGLLVDECRHFFGKTAIKDLVDVMAAYKLNRLHWHLTDAEAWRIDIPGHPEIVRHGAVNRDHVDRRRKWKSTWEPSGRGEKYGPFFYTEADLREVVAYAKARAVTVVPELEMPAHARALLLSHPEFSCRGKDLPYEPHDMMGPQYEVLCAGNEEALVFMEKLLDWFCTIFDSDTIHIGGDECPMNRWKACAKCQARIKALGLKDEPALQAYLTKRMTAHLAKKGRKAMAWDETIHGTLPATLTMQIWRNPEYLEAAAKAGCEVVASCGRYFYLDGGGKHYVDDPFDWYGYDGTSLGDVYAFDADRYLSPAHRGRLRGIEGCNWAELTCAEQVLQWKIWPRGCALAELAWSDDANREYGDFLRRVKQHEKDLRNRWKVNCGPVTE